MGRGEHTDVTPRREQLGVALGASSRRSCEGTLSRGASGPKLVRGPRDLGVAREDPHREARSAAPARAAPAVSPLGARVPIATAPDLGEPDGRAFSAGAALAPRCAWRARATPSAARRDEAHVEREGRAVVDEPRDRRAAASTAEPSRAATSARAASASAVARAIRAECTCLARATSAPASACAARSGGSVSATGRDVARVRAVPRAHVEA